jgi:hypothetical protein
MKIVYKQNGEGHPRKLSCILYTDEGGITLAGHLFDAVGFGNTEAEAKNDLQVKINKHLEDFTNELTQALRFVTSHE